MKFFFLLSLSFFFFSCGNSSEVTQKIDSTSSENINSNQNNNGSNSSDTQNNSNDDNTAENTNNIDDNDSNNLDSSATIDDSDTAIEESITYTSHIKFILDQNCIRCHSTEKTGRQRNGAPSNVNWNTYAEAIKNADRGNNKIQAGAMPPNSDGLAQSDKDLFQKWIDDGKME